MLFECRVCCFPSLTTVVSKLGMSKPSSSIPGYRTVTLSRRSIIALSRGIVAFTRVIALCRVIVALSRVIIALAMIMTPATCATAEGFEEWDSIAAQPVTLAHLTRYMFFVAVPDSSCSVHAQNVHQHIPWYVVEIIKASGSLAMFSEPNHLFYWLVSAIAGVCCTTRVPTFV